MLVILESTTYPGTTDELMLPMFEDSGPEGRRGFLPVFFAGARGSRQSQISDQEYSQSGGRHHARLHRDGRAVLPPGLETVVPVGSTRVAEMVKLLENTFRMINIGLVNEIALMCDRMGINVWEVIDAAATKPFGFMPFYPAPAWAAIASPSIRFIFPGKPSRPASRRASSSWPAISTARCRTSWWTRFRTR